MIAGGGSAAPPTDDAVRSDPVVEVRQRLAEGPPTPEPILEILLTNRGQIPVLDVVAVIRPDGRTITAASPTPEVAGGQYHWRVGRLEPGECRVVRLQLAGDDAGDRLRCAVRVGYRAEAEHTADIAYRPPGLKVVVEPAAGAVAGAPAILQVKITNDTNRAARQPVLQAKLPDGLTHPFGRDLENSLGPINPGETRTVHLEVTPTRGGELRGQLRVIDEHNRLTVREYAIVAQESKLTIAGRGPRHATVAGPVTLEFEIANVGIAAAPQGRLVAQLPEGMAFSSADGGDYSPDSHCVTWVLGDLQPGERWTLKLNAIARAAGEQPVRAILSAASGARHWATVSTSVAPSANPAPRR